MCWNTVSIISLLERNNLCQSNKWLTIAILLFSFNFICAYEWFYLSCYFQRRSLRERKKKTYKDDFDYNLSDEDGEKEPAENSVPSGYGGDGTAQNYVPVGPEVEETTTVEKILAMRTKQVLVLFDFFNFKTFMNGHKNSLEIIATFHCLMWKHWLKFWRYSHCKFWYNSSKYFSGVKDLFASKSHFKDIILTSLARFIQKPYSAFDQLCLNLLFAGWGTWNNWGILCQIQELVSVVFNFISDQGNTNFL